MANEACDAGRVAINGRAAKAGTEVKPGDIVEVGFAAGKVRFEVLSTAESAKKADSASMYRIIEE